MTLIPLLTALTLTVAAGTIKSASDEPKPVKIVEGVPLVEGVPIVERAVVVEGVPLVEGLPLVNGVALVEGQAQNEIDSVIESVANVQPRRGVTVERRQGGQTVREMRIVEKNGDRTIELIVKGDNVSVKHNGKKLDDDRVLSRGNTIIVLGGDGDELTRFTVDGMPVPGSVQTLRRGVNIGSIAGEPRLVIGVNISEVSDELRQHLGIGVPAVRIEGIVDGMPAAKAGLKANDIIVSVDGSKGVGSENLSAKINASGGKKPITLRIIRKGQAQTVKLKPVASRPGNLPAVIQLEGREIEPAFVGRTYRFPADGNAERVKKEMAQLERSIVEMEQERRVLSQELENIREPRAVEKLSLRVAELASEQSKNQLKLLELTNRLRSGPARAPIAPGGPATPDNEWLRWSTPDAFPGGQAFRLEAGDGGRGFVFRVDPDSMDELADRLDGRFGELEEMLREHNIAFDGLDELRSFMDDRGDRMDMMNDRFEHMSDQLNRVDRLSENMERLDDRLDRIERMLERLLDDRR